MMSKMTGYALCYKSNRDGEVWWHYTYDTYQEAIKAAKNLFASDKDYTWWIDDLFVR